MDCNHNILWKTALILKNGKFFKKVVDRWIPWWYSNLAVADEATCKKHRRALGWWVCGTMFLDN
jgi:hypothetical protein